MAEKYYSWSPYAYVMNNPMKFIDPTGMDSENGLTNNLEPEKSSWERMMENKSRSDDYKVKNYISTAGSPTDIVTKDGTIIGHYPDGQNALYCADELNPIYATPYGGSLPVSIGGVSYMYNLNTRALSGPMGEVGLINVHPEFDLLFAGRGIANVIAKKALSSGLSNMETRLWYNKQLRNLNISVSYTEENAILIHGQRNGLKAQARSMMADRDAAALLDITDPLKPMDYYVTKYSVQGYSGEALWKKIIESASKPNTIINSKFGIK